MAQRLGALDLLILLPDPELGILRPAPGFRQTLPGGSTWTELLGRCAGGGEFRATIAYPDVQRLSPADVFITPDGAVLMLIGGQPRVRASELAGAAGLVLALLRSEAREDAASASARASGDVTRRATALASSLDRARADLAKNAAALRDALSDAARLNDELRLLNETLEQRVRNEIAERAKAEDALRQAQKMEAIGRLTGGVAHDFNNLLSPIIGSLDMLVRRGVGGEREQRLVDGALQSAERAKILVQRLLAFARRQPLQPGAVDLNQLVRDMAQLIASTMGATVEVRVELPDDLPPVTADANQLEMALLNLAVNARDAMPGGGMLKISAEPEQVIPGKSHRLRAGRYVRLSVSDTGVGMDEATLSRAIEPFFSTKGVGSGTGLGLSMVHGLALQQNGDLAITSREGAGTTVDLWLPVSGAPAGANDGPGNAAEPLRGSGTALLVDDEDLVRMCTAQMLMELGYRVEEANSAEAALRLLDAGLCPDLLVTDHIMPRMSGAQLARLLTSRIQDLPVLIVSGYAEADGVPAGIPRLCKPFRQAELAASIAALMPTTAIRRRKDVRQ
ncbi:ATP-binding protein [Brevundimonas sp.]|uniref:ATP-binding protein n=1 Tax=Brevundimonas sp. TaxID=1871086 RepID=UPI002D3C86DE|nr:ATP-binding protein [Brevundimonas sp.]HYC75025.1 ATP-binding protein [Brevundimonas sp.]